MIHLFEEECQRRTGGLWLHFAFAAVAAKVANGLRPNATTWSWFSHMIATSRRSGRTQMQWMLHFKIFNLDRFMEHLGHVQQGLRSAHLHPEVLMSEASG